MTFKGHLSVIKGDFMDSFLFAIKAVLPIILTVALGYLLKRAGFMTEDFAKKANKLVFKVFLPSMLFLNVYKTDLNTFSELGYILYVLLFTVAVFLVSIPLVLFVTKKKDRQGPLIQATFRSNFALIGLPLAQALFGQEGVIVASLLSAATIPLFNVFAVISLTVFCDNKQKISIRNILAGVVKNPLIQSIFIGFVVLVIRILFQKFNFDFRISQTPIYTVLGYLSNMATPLALLVLGAQFEFSAVKELKKEILFGTLMRTVFVPAIAISVATLFFKNSFSGAHYASFIAVFATPVAVSSVPMVQEMKGNSTLAGQLVVWTTLTSALTVFIFTFILKHFGFL